MRQPACLIITSVIVDDYAALFNSLKMFPLRIGVWNGLRLVIVALTGLSLIIFLSIIYS